MRYAACAALCLSVTAVLAQPDVAERTITVEQARQSVQNVQGTLYLPVTSLSPEVVAELVPLQGTLELQGIEAVPNDIADLLAHHPGRLSMPKLAELTNPALAEKLIASVDDVRSLSCLRSLRVMSDDVERVFGGQKGRITLPALTRLSTSELAARLCDGNDSVRLPEVRTVSPAAAEVLAKATGTLDLPVLDALESRALAAKLRFHVNGDTRRVALISPEVAELWVEEANANRGGFLGLALTTVSPEVAAVLARLDGDLQLPRLETLTAPAARALAAHAGDLELGVTVLSPEAAHELRPHAHALRLPGLKELSRPLWDELAGHGGGLSLSGVKHLPIDVVAALPQRVGSVSLGLEEVSPALARELIKVKGALGLSDVPTLDDAAQDTLARHSDKLYLSGLTSLTSVALARKLGSQTLDPIMLPENGGIGCLTLPNVTELSPEVARGLALHTGGLSLDGLTKLPKDVAAALSECPGHLYLPAVVTLDDEAAEALSRHKGEDLSLGVKELSDAAVASLARHPGDGLYLGVTAVSDRAARSLAAFGGQSLGLGVTELSDEAALALAGFKGKSLGLGNLQNVSAQGQDALAGYVGRLWFGPMRTLLSKALAEKVVAAWPKDRSTNHYLDEVTTVSPEAAEVLAQCQGPLYMPKIAELSSATLARKLAATPRFLDGLRTDTFRHVESLSPEAARELAAARVAGLDLESLATLTPDVAAELAKFKGWLGFGSLEIVPDDVADALSGHVGGVTMPRLVSLTGGKLAEVIQHAPQSPLDCLFPEVHTLSAEAATALARRGLLDDLGYSGRGAWFPKLETVSNETADAIGASGARPSLRTFPAFRELTNAALAEKLFAHYETWHWQPGGAPTDKLTAISPGVARVLGRCKSLDRTYSALHLNGLQRLDAETARGLAAFDGPLSLNGLKTISPEVATGLAKHREKSSKESGFVPEPIIYLDGVCELSKDSAEALAEYGGEVSLGGLDWDKLPDDVKAVIHENDKVLIVKKPK